MKFSPIPWLRRSDIESVGVCVIKDIEDFGLRAFAPDVVERKIFRRYRFSEQQLSSLEQLFPNDIYPPEITFHKNPPSSYRDHRARRILQPLGHWPCWPLPLDAGGTSRWRSSDSYRDGKRRHRVLQCRSGVDPTAAAKPPSGRAQGRSTHAFSGCLTHVHIICEAVLDAKGNEDVDACGPTLAIHGVLQHSENCNELPFAAIKELPRHIGNVRFWLTKDDIATIWRGLRKEILSTDSNLSGEQNIHNFLTGMLTATSDRFELGIASPPMREAAWRYSHGKLILMDGTFGVCLQKILLLIVLVINEKYKGIPVALFLFSAPPNNRQTFGGYDAAILLRLLLKWKAALGKKDGEGFTPKVWLLQLFSSDCDLSP
ncbi:hypothetical protein BDK51DRAFT_33941 [Blyttiomyces helicus]|uniref:Uncharacterized protein n=1 Tax=Blyttiomyces helicus TaxID=388810 RepID=A0A4P9W8D8_9FUNG|nr:hypothetical protein BDK51DRAFT_33941 [Blyttiomyces helicus]|eukprot:RKO87338.1 hypothetical protein BDK51DRAFT_33941 [Blyttiomyces helicus]